jgi:hypothetical protein
MVVVGLVGEAPPGNHTKLLKDSVYAVPDVGSVERQTIKNVSVPAVAPATDVPATNTGQSDAPGAAEDTSVSGKDTVEYQ